MSSSAEQMRNYSGPALFSYGFRPFFLGGALVAALAPLIAVFTLSGTLPDKTSAGIIAWHGHEMVFGYLSAVIAGFILTAVPNWTGRLPILGARLIGLASLWLVGRAAMLAALFGYEVFAPFGLALIEVSFLFILDVVIWREVIAGKNWGNLPVCILILLIALANLLWYVDIARGGSGMIGSYSAIGGVSVLLALIGGRVAPSFTRNWLNKTGRKTISVPFAFYDKISMAVLAAALFFWL